MTPQPRDLPLLGRRAFLLTAGVAAAAAGCSTTGPPAPVQSPGRTAGRSPSFTPPPRSAPYAPIPQEALGGLKAAAAAFVQGLTTYDAAANPRPSESLVATSRISAGDLRAAAAALLVPGRYSRGTIELVQFGGLAPVSPAATYAACLVVVRQELTAPDGRTRAVSRTLDVRLRRTGDTWTVTYLPAVSPPRAAPAALARASTEFLADKRLALADSARWDVYSGRISPALMSTLRAVAAVGPLTISVLATGHPRNVIDGRANGPISAHFRGRAGDIYEVGGVPVAQLPAGTVRDIVTTAGGQPDVAQVGVPAGYDLDGGGLRFFSNLVHSDHVHVAVRA